MCAEFAPQRERVVICTRFLFSCLNNFRERGQFYEKRLLLADSEAGSSPSASEKSEKGSAKVDKAEIEEGEVETLHPEPQALHPTPYTLHPTPYTLHPTPHTLLHPTPRVRARARREMR